MGWPKKREGKKSWREYVKITGVVTSQEQRELVEEVFGQKESYMLDVFFEYCVMAFARKMMYKPLTLRALLQLQDEPFDPLLDKISRLDERQLKLTIMQITIEKIRRSKKGARYVFR